MESACRWTHTLVWVGDQLPPPPGPFGAKSSLFDFVVDILDMLSTSPIPPENWWYFLEPTMTVAHLLGGGWGITLG